MFFWLSKTIARWLFPVPVCLGLIIMGLIFIKRKPWARPMAITGVVLLYLFSTPTIPGLITVAWQWDRPDYAALKPQYDVAIVLSGTMNARISKPGHYEFQDSVDRIIQGALLVKTGQAKTLLIAGGSGSLNPPPVKEPEFLTLFAQELGLHPDQIVIEDVSRSTYESAKLAPPVIKKHGWQDILLVTSATHMRRSVACFKKQGIAVTPYPVDYDNDGSVRFEFKPSPLHLRRLDEVWHEILGYMTYKMTGKI